MRFIRFWGSKPNHTISTLIGRYSKKNSLILDVMGGKGTSVVESLRLGRRIIYNDLNPYAFFVAKTLTSPVDLQSLDSAFKVLLQRLTKKRYKIRVGSRSRYITFDVLYSIRCQCGRPAGIRQVTWSIVYRKKPGSYRCRRPDTGKLEWIATRIMRHIKKNEFTHLELLESVARDRKLRKLRRELITRAINVILVKRHFLEVVGEKPIRILYNRKCECGLKQRPAGEHDWKALKHIDSYDSVYPYPGDELRYANGGAFYKRRLVSRIDQLFTKRNLIALSILFHEIRKLECSNEIRDALVLCFASMLFSASRMQREEGGAWSVGCYWIPPTFVERNVLLLFKSRFHRFANWKNGSKVRYSIARHVRSVIEGKAAVAFTRRNALRLPIPDESVDYVIVDPPQMDEIQYFELSYLAACWLGFRLPFKEEIIVNPKQGKGEDKYWRMMQDALREIDRVLRPNGRVTVMLHEEKRAYYSKFHQLLAQFPYRMISTTFQEYDFDNKLHRNDLNRLNGDYYFTLQKVA